MLAPVILKRFSIDPFVTVHAASPGCSYEMGRMAQALVAQPLSEMGGATHCLPVTVADPLVQRSRSQRTSEAVDLAGGRS